MTAGNPTLKIAGYIGFSKAGEDVSKVSHSGLREFQIKKYPKISCGGGILLANNSLQWH
ncbi:hypothetical protein MEN41_14760 [Dolichospermum sp. ST_con]|nr:hypothetical protein [Dolichospermum sp. ST_con]MDD1422156.1 hypothetical protein [Dolichospermum sp. ST_sed1]MDD1423348.1 hypothetical protein [Dolichospermum sp. ST_sed9]MDD1442526.1 hypothetical protein [Dolichospermum sp. ST_sed3]MDD1448636.1 hypothetical protein [Dolichospermum sp. ST_sed8]MDD1456721.1 hypothetical protein [Dolichospermum sp. ST_sed7]MDD1459334.1 hypothetical protein [Dolichospermum sp. ST_sed2]MDD1466110.1 hypothetical protein [Dolichospermum sp. ST_sed5]MDD1473402